MHHNLGVLNGILNVEAIRIVQAKFDKHTLMDDEVRWDLENLKVDEAHAAALGAKGLFHSINVTQGNHEGDGRVAFQQWDGTKWNVISDRIAPDWRLLQPIVERSSLAYAKEKSIKVRTNIND